MKIRFSKLKNFPTVSLRPGAFRQASADAPSTAAGYRNHLRWWDIAALTAIMWGSSIYSSTVEFFSQSASEDGAAAANVAAQDFSAADNLWALLNQSGLLLLAIGYLVLRRFNFRQWIIAPSLRGTFVAVGVFLASGIVYEVAYALQQLVSFDGAAAAAEAGGALSAGDTPLQGITDPSLVVYSLFNGFYEEIFFLGICLAVSARYRALAFVYSLVIRFSFHTYMGLFNATCLALIVGGIYYLVWRKCTGKNLYPLIAAHAASDVFGVGVLQFLPEGFTLLP